MIFFSKQDLKEYWETKSSMFHGGFISLIIGWLAYPINMIALLLLGGENQGFGIIVSALIYSLFLLSIGIVIGSIIGEIRSK